MATGTVETLIVGDGQAGLTMIDMLTGRCKPHLAKACPRRALLFSEVKEQAYMATVLTVSHPVDLPTALAPDVVAAVNYARAEKAPATRKAYATDFFLFCAWCDAKGASALPARAETVAAYLAAEVDRGTKAPTLGRRMAAIRHAHKLANLQTPTDAEAVKATLRGIRRTLGAAKVKKAAAIAERIKPKCKFLNDKGQVVCTQQFEYRLTSK
jgi:hypothetical protein